MKTRSRPQSCASPSSASVKYRAHFAVAGVAHGSSVNENSAWSGSKTSGGVSQ